MPGRAGKIARKEDRKRAEQIARSQPDLVEQLNDQVSFLRGSAKVFDRGDQREAKRIAVALRVLVHDTPKSHALLTQLGVQASIDYLDTADPLDLSNMGTTLGFLNLGLKWGSPPRGSYVPRLDDIRTEIGPRWVPFDDWWTRPVSRVPETNLDVSRKDYVLVVANREGGAHVDLFFTPLYEALAKQNAFGWTVGRTTGGVDENLGPLSNNPVLAAVRQIGHEMLRTIDRHLWRLVDARRMGPPMKPSGDFDLMVQGVAVQGVEASAVEQVRTPGHTAEEDRSESTP
jgi:hypothetical protein